MYFNSVLVLEGARRSSGERTGNAEAEHGGISAMDSPADGCEADGEMTALMAKDAEDQGFAVGDEVEHLQNRLTASKTIFISARYK